MLVLMTKHSYDIPSPAKHNINMNELVKSRKSETNSGDFQEQPQRKRIEHVLSSFFIYSSYIENAESLSLAASTEESLLPLEW
mmetsp:Transcript_1740/g.2010  ORF Transcript_1740/g.2010 Transcript_1740/m.2010 type:complete len:83 (+) Transcript_1740:30-278(+)